MFSHPRKPACLVLAFLLLLGSLLYALAAQTTPLSRGDQGRAVLDLKNRLFDLGYYDSARNFNDSYSAETAEKIMEFQAFNLLAQTGEADRETLEALYGADAVKAPLKADRPYYNIDPDALVSLLPADAPVPGSLGQGDAPYVISDREGGFWYYLSDRLEVSVTRYDQAAGQLEWFEVYINYPKGGLPFTQESAGGGHRAVSPLRLAEEAGAVLAINDDYYRYRVANHERIGVILRDGMVKSDEGHPQRRSRIPSLEVLALFSDGSLKTFASDAHTAAEYLDMGVTDTFAFGPALVQQGEVPRYFYSKDYRSYREPRCALGMVGPGAYCALVVTGRKTGSKGATFGWMAEKMLAMGAKEALNLDGGGTTALIFMGELLNHDPGFHNIRPVTGIIAFK